MSRVNAVVARIWCFGCCSTSAGWGSRCGGACRSCWRAQASPPSARCAVRLRRRCTRCCRPVRSTSSAWWRWGSAWRSSPARMTCHRSHQMRLPRHGWRWWATCCAGRCCCGVPTAVESGAGTRRLDRLGGLLHHMPVTAGMLPARAVRHRRVASRSRICRVLAVVPVAARRGADWRSWRAVVDRRRRRAGRAVGRPGCTGAVRLFGVVFLGVRARRVRRSPEDAPRPVRLFLAAWRHRPVCLACCRVWPWCRRPDGRMRRRVRSMAGLAHRRRDAGLFASRGRCTARMAVFAVMWVIAPPRRGAARAGMVRRIRRAAAMAAVRRSGDAVRSRVLHRTAAALVGSAAMRQWRCAQSSCSLA